MPILIRPHRLRQRFGTTESHTSLESDLWDEFERRSIPLLEGHKPVSAWEWYFLMQHYGLPTRLLDWTECSLVGLYFAVGDWKGRGEPSVEDAVVWMLNPWYMNQKDEIYRYDDDDISDYLPEAPFVDYSCPDNPVALMPWYNSRRLTAQRGVFTIHGLTKKPIDEILPEADAPQFARIVIPKDRIAEMRESLRISGITDVAMFPEVSFLCQDIAKAWRILGPNVRVGR